MKKLISLILALVMVMGLAVTASAQDVTYSGENTGNGTITVTNAAKGVTYTIYKLFDATVSEDGKAINYTGSIPTELESYFAKDAAGNITAKDAAKNGSEMSDNLRAALKAWAGSATSLLGAEADGSQLCFKNLPYGYYVVTTTQGQTAISVNSTNPTAEIIDKNTTTPQLTKAVNGTTFSIGDTITYTLTFTTANYDGETKITRYSIEDTLPEWLSDVTVTKVTIGGLDYKVEGNYPQFSEKQIIIPWTDTNGNSLYANGAQVVITYTATLNNKATIGATGNTNTAKLHYNNGNTPEQNQTVYSYSFDVVKTDSNKNILTGAEFELYDAQTGGNKIPLVKESEGVYHVADQSERVENFTSAVITAGKASIKGLKNGTYYLEETKAPEGYNKLTTRQELTIDGTNLDATISGTDYTNGGVQVINNAGSELPSTGGMGTTLFYVLGGLMMVGAAVVLVTKKRVA